MSSRQEEKERRKRERQERAAAEQAKAAQRKRMQLVFGGLLGVGALVAIAAALVLLVFNGDGANDEVEAARGSVTLPAQQESDPEKAAELAGCTYEPKLANEGAGHEEKDFAAADYQQNPPTSGNHFPQWYEDGIYSPGDVPNLGMLVHTLEHGRIDLQYKPGTPATTIAQLEKLYEEMDGGHHLLLFENTTKMPFQVAATAWDASLGCNKMNDKVFDAIRAFRTEHIDKGPEVVP
jgi:hypothetical protein